MKYIIAKNSTAAWGNKTINETQISEFFKLSPEDNITFEINITVPTGTVHYFTIIDFFLIPLFNVTDLNLTTVLMGWPVANHWAYGDMSDFLLNKNEIIYPKVSIDSTQNTLFFDFSEVYNEEATPKHLQMWFTLTVTNESKEDELDLANHVQIDYDNAFGAHFKDEDII